MKQWMQKLVSQFDINWGDSNHKTNKNFDSITEDRATLLFMIDTLNKHLVEIEGKPLRKTRQMLDDFSLEILKSNDQNLERVLFRWRQFFSSFRIDEYSYVLRTFDEFRSIIWDFVDQLSDELYEEINEKEQVNNCLGKLKDAVEASSIEEIKKQSREFIDRYVEFQSKREVAKSNRLNKLKKNLDVVRKKLSIANEDLHQDHLTKAYNRKYFDECLKDTWKLNNLSSVPISLIYLDIDHFKKINDNFGHDIGDFVLVEFVKILNESFPDENHHIFRIGGEEFAVLLPELTFRQALKLGEKSLDKIRNDILVHGENKIKFTSSMGVAQLEPNESIDSWKKRADDALYEAKNLGRDQAVLAPHLRLMQAAS